MGRWVREVVNVLSVAREETRDEPRHVKARGKPRAAFGRSQGMRAEWMEVRLHVREQRFFGRKAEIVAAKGRSLQARSPDFQRIAFASSHSSKAERYGRLPLVQSSLAFG